MILKLMQTDATLLNKESPCKKAIIQIFLSKNVCIVIQFYHIYS